MTRSIQTNLILPRQRHLLAALGLLLIALLTAAFLAAPGDPSASAANTTSPSAGLVASEAGPTLAGFQPAPTAHIAFGSTGEIGDTDDPGDIKERCDSGMFCFPDRDRG